MKLKKYLKENKITNEDRTEGLGYTLDVSLDNYSGCRIYAGSLEHKSGSVDAMQKYFDATDKMDSEKRKIFGDKFMELNKSFCKNEIEKKRKEIELEVKRILDTVSVIIKGKVEQSTMWLDKEYDKMIAKVKKEVK
jgi:hypothetical protein